MVARLVIMGVCGCGKSTVGAALAARLGMEFVDGDSLHPPENIEKMSAGVPLDDADRAPWLDRVGQRLANATGPGLIVACSALKRAYRDRIRDRAGKQVVFLHLAGPRAVIEKRMSARSGHFMPTSLIDSQFAALEPFATGESHLVVDLDQPVEAIVDELASGLG